MDHNKTRPMTPFDEQTIPSNLHTLKLLLPYTPVSTQRSLGILIKFLELMHTIRFFQRFGRLPGTAPPSASPIGLLENLSDFLTPEESELVDQFRSILNMMEMFSMMQEFQDFSEETDFSNVSSGSPENPESSGSSKSTQSYDSSGRTQTSPKKGGFFGNGNPMDVLMGMLSPEQQEMFHTYQDLFSDSETINNTTSSKEDETNG